MEIGARHARSLTCHYVRPQTVGDPSPMPHLTRPAAAPTIDLTVHW